MGSHARVFRVLDNLRAWETKMRLARRSLQWVAGLGLFGMQDDLRQVRLNQLQKEVAIGAEQIERGQYTDYDVENLQPLVDEIQAAGRKRLAKRVGERRQ